MNKKFLITIVTLLAIVVGLWIWTLAIPSNVVNIGGSASVDPLMQRLTNKYKEDKKQSFIYSSTGSTSGINNLKSGVYEIGFVSKEVPKDAFEEIEEISPLAFHQKGAQIPNKEQFDNYFNEQKTGYKYVNFANDYIVFIYNTENTGFDEDLHRAFSLTVKENGTIANNEVLRLIYEHDNPAKLTTWKTVAEVLKRQNSSLKIDQVKDEKVIPYSSTPGSGTRTSFENLTGVIPGEAVNQYGNNGSIFTQILKTPGSFGFVSLAYAQELVKSEFQKLKTVIIKKGAEEWNIAKDPEKANYPLTRPFNGIFYYDRHKKNMNKILNFVFWFATDQSIEELYKEEGLTQIVLKKDALLLNQEKKYWGNLW